MFGENNTIHLQCGENVDYNIKDTKPPDSSYLA
jgi:hypothetical protein